jgi:hypothetical protein
MGLAPNPHLSPSDFHVTLGDLQRQGSTHYSSIPLSVPQQVSAKETENNQT